jgi:Zn-dependent protease
MDPYNILARIAVFALPVIFAITVHEAAHGYAAKHFGDRTAFMLGRVSLNPVKHIEILGTVILPLITVAFGNFIFGWAKPVPVNEKNLRSPKRDMIWVAAAGPGANLAMMLGWAVVAKLVSELPFADVNTYWYSVAEAGIYVNILIGVFNLLPLLPLDGGRIVQSLLPDRLSYAYSHLEPIGLPILLLLMFTPVLGWIVGPVLSAGMTSVHSVFGLP